MIIRAAGTEREDRKAIEDPDYPTVAEVAGQVLDSVFVDRLNSDLEVLQRINQTLDKTPAGVRSSLNLGLKHIDALVISPNQDLAALSSKHARSLPPMVRFFFHRIGINQRTGSAVLSYLLFESGYTRELIALDYADAMRQKEAIRQFFGVSQPSGGDRRRARPPLRRSCVEVRYRACLTKSSNSSSGNGRLKR